MEVKVDIAFNELVAVVRWLSPEQKARLQKELAEETKQGPEDLVYGTVA